MRIIEDIWSITMMVFTILIMIGIIIAGGIAAFVWFTT